MTDIKAVVAAYRRVADLLEAHPDIAQPSICSDGSIFWSLWSFECPDGVPAMVAKIRRIVGGKWDKSEQEGITSPEMVFSRDGYSITVRRDSVCTRRVVGTTTITKEAINLPERTETIEIVEWDCSPVLAEVSA